MRLAEKPRTVNLKSCGTFMFPPNAKLIGRVFAVRVERLVHTFPAAEYHHGYGKRQ